MDVRPQTQVNTAFLITGTTLINGRGGDARASTSVLTDAGRIAWIGPDENAPSIGDRPSIDSNGRCLIPGLINSHGHFANDGSTDHSDQVVNNSVPIASLRAPQNARFTLCSSPSDRVRQRNRRDERTYPRSGEPTPL